MIELSKEAKADIINSIKQFFLQERDEKLSDFKANIILEFILADIAPRIYNQGIQDACRFMSEKVEDMYGLEKRNR
ncbi:DUF2164 domain-containing protein [Acetonema longum]|uniref:DUF2164 domain-containing protein n=1 Tax=Acetonema longum DSM 6540 TaxID=1009370 RepID=F7NJU7_9FIRM|nr:DUF2164 domain-containing protein [Acetonema longum]EGO63679.1 hypothetical protein ALO_11784 [Acetonema longum DSM 6540]